jgi:Xaa-Pro aminopeptidase
MSKPDALIFGDSVTCSALRHELPVDIVVPGCYVERNGRRFGIFDELERPLFADFDDLTFVSLQSLGYDELLNDFETRQALLEAVARGCRQIGVKEAIVPIDFPLDVADYLRQNDISISCDRLVFERRRRVKSVRELEGIRRAQRAADEAMGVVRAALIDGERSCERLRMLVATTFAQSGMQLDGMIMSHGAQTADPLDQGSGEISAGEPITVDIWPRDVKSRCFADMTRTFCLGEAPPELSDMHAVCREVLGEVQRRIAPGVRTSELAAVACDIFERHGYRTFRDTAVGKAPTEGAIHMISHGVGLDIMEEPYVWLGDTELVAGDVISVEPGLYRPGWGGCRIEDLVHVVPGGVDVLTRFNYDLELTT